MCAWSVISSARPSPLPRATPLSVFLFFHLFCHQRLPGRLPACLPASSVASLLLFTSPFSPLSLSLSLALPLSVRRPLCPGIVQLKCRNCPLEFILKFVARQPFIYHVPTVFRDTFRFDRDIEPSLDSSLPPSLPRIVDMKRYARLKRLPNIRVR